MDEFIAQQKAILNGEEVQNFTSINQVTNLPKGYVDWIEANKERLATAKSIPYFIKDNYVGGDLSKGLNSAKSLKIHPSPVLLDLKVFEKGGAISIYSTVDKNSGDFKDVLACCESFALSGSQVSILPKINAKDPAYREIYRGLIGTPYEGKCPDFSVEGIFYEHEGFTAHNPKSNFSNMLSRGLKQSDKIVVEECGLSDHYMKRIINARIQQGVVINEVWIKKDSNLRLFYKRTEARQ